MVFPSLLITPGALRGTPRIRVVADFVVDLMKRHAAAMAG